jgi:hypothetical protein
VEANHQRTMTSPMIATSFLGPTDHRPPRVTARHERDRSETYSIQTEWDHSLNSEENHRRAAEKLAQKIGFYDGRVKVEAVGHDFSHYYFTAVPA